MVFHWRILQQHKVHIIHSLVHLIHYNKFIRTIQQKNFLKPAGLTFWKCPRRKIYGILRNEIKDDTPRKRSSRVFDSDDDFEPCSRKQKTDDKLEILLSDVGSIKDSLTDIFSLDENSHIPLGLKRVIRDTFKCAICHHVPIHPPIIVTKCCKTILGCEKCVNTWYSGPEMLSKTCPSCRADRGCNETMVLRGLDDFLTQMAKVLQTGRETDQAEDN